MPNTLRKSERLDRKKVIEKMFACGSRSFSVFPLRVVYLPVEELEAPVSILVSVSKRRFKRAVKRNRVKRQIREAYRMNKHGLLAVLTEKKCRLAVAFIYLSDQLVDSSVIEDRMKTALASHLFLSEVHIAHDRAFMPFYPHLFAICGGGHQETRTFQGVLSGSQAHSALPSLGRFRI